MKYVYGICEPEEKPFYIGKGGKQRFLQHLREARKGNPKSTYVRMRELFARNIAPEFRIFLATEDNELACQEEARLIALFGKKHLTNQFDGENLAEHCCYKCHYVWKTRMRVPKSCPKCKIRFDRHISNKTETQKHKMPGRGKLRVGNAGSGAEIMPSLQKPFGQKQASSGSIRRKNNERRT